MDREVLATRVLTGRTLSAVRCDLTLEEVDAIVNAANTHLDHGGGLAGAIVARGGEIIQEESDHLAPVPVGSAVTTGAGALPCRWVIHAVGPQWGEGDEEAKLRSAVRASLEEAQRVGAASVAIPAISTGIFGYPKPAGVAVLISEASRWLEERPDTGIRELRFAAHDSETAALLAAALRSSEAMRL